ncbi:hypothetical protein BDV98DRAFT_588228 [Pterulicium gracile]|uniref:Uncharacterized protein n=1 Tax=Pterulicium gracile TaxID=1884261 RepID=A0A5C3R0S3_9AGAR|nr:hypothetical protein BDV98DRAFT_588228 [Pterula gracilis]
MSPRPSRHSTIPWLDSDGYDRYPKETSPRRSDSRHKVPSGAASYVRDGLPTPSSSQNVTPTSQKSRDSRSPNARRQRSRSPHERGRAHSPPGILRKGHEQGEVSLRNALHKRSRSAHNLNGAKQVPNPPATHKRVRHAVPAQEREQPPSHLSPYGEQLPPAGHKNGPRVGLPHHRAYDPQHVGDVWPVPAVSQVQHLGVGLDRPRRRRGDVRRDQREADSHQDLRRRHSCAERMSPAEELGSYDEQERERKTRTSRRKTDRDISSSDVPAYLMHAREQIRRQAMENIKGMSRPVDRLQNEQIKSQFYNEHYVYLSQQLCENMEAWLRFRVQEMFKNAYKHYGALPDRDHELMRRKSRQRAPLEDMFWTDIETSHPASYFKRVTLGRRVKRDYRALKSDLLDALGGLTPEPRLVFDCLVNVSTCLSKPEP